VYHRQTKPLVDYYLKASSQKKSLRFLTMSGVGNIDTIRAGLKSLLAN
jgi:adenylate kinase family enzyme